jgi:hypothetical protein
MSLATFFTSPPNFLDPTLGGETFNEITALFCRWLFRQRQLPGVPVIVGLHFAYRVISDIFEVFSTPILIRIRK